jgi:ribosome-binding protein aMBF1 (putative translation factor)
MMKQDSIINGLINSLELMHKKLAQELEQTNALIEKYNDGELQDTQLEFDLDNTQKELEKKLAKELLGDNVLLFRSKSC